MRKSIILLLALIWITSAMTIPCGALDEQIALTESEAAFIREHPVITLGVDPGFVPFEFIDQDGDYKGIAADYLALISERTGLQFDIIRDVTWPEAYDMALAGKVDALPAIGKTEEREKTFLFSEPYYYYKRVIVTRDTDKDIGGMDDLNGLTVAVQRNSSHHSYLLSHPKINLSLFDSVEAALTAVATGSEKAFVGNLATTDYFIRSNALTNLRLIAFEAEKEQALYFAVRKDWPELISIVNKVLHTISESERIAINNQWISLNQEIDYGPMIRVVSILGALIVVVISVSFFWIVRLRKEVGKRRLIQADLEQAKHEAETANQVKSSFLARMSHEIRTPLNAITGMAYLLKKTELSLTQRMYADKITQASSNMLNIINDILDFSKIESGKIEMEHTSFSMDQLIQNVVNIISYKIEEQGIGFRMAKDPLVPNWFFGDPQKVEQILLNILSNASKFTERGEVSLDIRLIAKESDHYHLSLTVTDTGIGMTEEQIQKLYAPFAQGDSSINRRFGGTGLGLSIVKSFVEMMNGQIQVFSTSGEGTTFIIRLSFLVDKEKESVYLKTLSGDYFKNVRTLVLEKTGSSMNLIDSYLSAFGMHCELTTSQISAVSMLEAADGKFAKPFDLMIVDYQTPQEGGFAFIEAIRKNAKIIYKPKIILMLPMRREDLFDKLNDYEIDLGIGKPVIPSILFNGILDIFKLKAVSAAQPSERREGCPAPLDRPRLVLVAEDNKTNQLIAQSLLKQIGVESILAADGEAAVAAYRRERDRIDMILMDLHMPIMSGYEAAQEIREISQRVPIVAMTADVVLGVKEQCEASGIHHYIGKPFDPDEFLRVVKEILEKDETTRENRMEVLDQDAGLKNIGGNTAVYRQILHEYSVENRDTLVLLQQEIQEKRYADAAQRIHKIKSSSGSIGANRLHALAVQFQKALDEKQTEEIVLLQEEFSDMLGKLLEEISQLE